MAYVYNGRQATRPLALLFSLSGAQKVAQVYQDRVLGETREMG